MFSRREFIKSTCGAGCLLLSPVPSKIFQGAGLAQAAEIQRPVEARYYEKQPNRKIKCVLCPRECVIDDLERGYCGVRENRGGTYYTLVYGNPCAVHVDPLEKKPLFHFLPGTNAFSLATAGCNVLCKFCQNWEISQARPEEVKAYQMPPRDIADLAKENGCSAIAYTYTEPVIFTEYMHDTAAIAGEKGIKSVMISNGYIKAEPMRDLCQVLHAVKIDLKAYTERFYRELVNGELKPVLETLVLLKSLGMWTEIVYLVIPSQNDDKNELQDLCKWIVAELGPDTPIHFSRFHPQYRLKNLPPTPISVLQTAKKIALDAGIHFPYIGNVPGDPGENTYCPSCGTLLIRRIGFTIVENKLSKNLCSKCRTKIPGIWL